MTNADIKRLIAALEDDQLAALRYMAFQLQEPELDEDERNAAFRETLLLELLSMHEAMQE